MKSHNRNRKISKTVRFRSKSLKSLKSRKRYRKSLKTKRKSRKSLRRQKGGFLNSVKNLLNSQAPSTGYQNNGKQVLLNTMCEQADDASLQNAPKLSGIINSLCVENAKANSMNSSMTGGQQSFQSNGMTLPNMNNLGGGVLGMVVNAATFPARMGLNVIKNVTGFHGNNLNLNSSGSSKQELVGGDVAQNINKIKENNYNIKSLKNIPKHLLEPNVYDNIQSLNSLDMVPA